MSQLALDLQPPRRGELATVTWWRGLPRRDGTRMYTVLIRDPSDPKRKLRASEAGDISPHLTLRKTSARTWAERILEHLSDGRPRTLNRIAVELVDKTADVIFTTTMHDGLWLLVEQELVEYTPCAPIYFRRVE